MSIMLCCLDHNGQNYVGMEMPVFMHSGDSELEFEPHFTKSVI